MAESASAFASAMFPSSEAGPVVPGTGMGIIVTGTSHSPISRYASSISPSWTSGATGQ